MSLGTDSRIVMRKIYKQEGSDSLSFPSVILAGERLWHDSSKSINANKNQRPTINNQQLITRSETVLVNRPTAPTIKSRLINQRGSRLMIMATKRIAFVGGNRTINKNNVKKHVESLKKFGKNLVPMLYVEATEVKGHTLYDAETGEVVAQEDYSKYWVILDGQHRYKAALQLALTDGFNLDSLRWEKVELNGKSFEDVLIEVNTRTQPWKGADYICGCVLHNPDTEVLQFAHKLISLGVSGKTVSKYLFFKDKFKWSDALSNPQVMADADVERAKEIWSEVQKFPLKVQKSSIIIDFIIKNGGTGHWRDELAKVAGIKDDVKEALGSLKQGELKREFEQMVAA